jgi:protein TonB
MFDEFAVPGGEVDFAVPETAVPVSPRGTGVADGDVLPIFKVTPNYPLTAAKRGVEGYVVIRFTVDELGRIVDPEIVEAMPAGIFNRSALEAVRRFKYRPRVLNGQPTRVTGMLHRLVYELAEA